MEMMSTMLFTIIETNAIVAFGESSKELLQQGVERFGLKDAEDLATIATQEGDIHTLFNYIPKNHQTSNKHENLTSFALFAKLFAQVTKAIVDVYGEQGEEVIRKSVWQFGQKRGQGIATRARVNDRENDVENYLASYDMKRSDLFEMSDDYHPNELEQYVTTCPLGQQWADDDTHQYGILYCQVIDNALAYGYNNKFDVIHDEYFLKTGTCHFRYQMKDKEISPLYD